MNRSTSGLEQALQPIAQNGISAMEESAAISREVAQVQGQMIIAKRFPRDEEQSLKKIEAACSRPALARSAVYEYARGGTSITGPSIRLAEAVARAWGNIKSGLEEIESNDRETKVRAYAYDLETNDIAEMIFTVRHVRDTKKGSTILTEQRDIYEAVANFGARRMRSCILKVIPGDVIDYAVELCNRTRAAEVKITPETIEKLVDAFRRFGVNRDMLEAFIQRKLEAVTTAQYLRLQDIWAGMRDGVTKVDDFFDLSLSDQAQAAAKAKAEQEKPNPKAKTGAKTVTAPVSANGSDQATTVAEEPQSEEDDYSDLDSIWDDDEGGIF